MWGLVTDLHLIAILSASLVASGLSGPMWGPIGAAVALLAFYANLATRSRSAERVRALLPVTRVVDSHFWSALAILTAMSAAAWWLDRSFGVFLWFAGLGMCFVTTRAILLGRFPVRHGYAYRAEGPILFWSWSALFAIMTSFVLVGSACVFGSARHNTASICDLLCRCASA